MTNRLADQLLAVAITLGCIDHVQSGVERAVQKLGDKLLRRAFVTDLRTAKAEHGHVHVRFSKPSLFHLCHVERSRDISNCQMRDSSTPLRMTELSYPSRARCDRCVLLSTFASVSSRRAARRSQPCRCPC